MKKERKKAYYILSKQTKTQNWKKIIFMFPYIRWDHWVKHSLMNYSCNLCRKNSNWQIKESWNRATRTKRLKKKTGKHLRVFYRIQIFSSPFSLVHSLSWKQNLSQVLLTSSDLVSRLTELVKGNSDWSNFTNDMRRSSTDEFSMVPLCQLNRFPSPEGFTFFF